MNIELFLMLLLIVSVLTSLTVEAIKKLTSKKLLPINALTAIVSLVISFIVGIFYIILMNVTFSASVVVYLISLIFLSWLCAMLGYDKVIQTLSQFKGGM